MPDTPDSILEAFLLNADQTPAKPCIYFEDTIVTYAALRAQARAFAGMLASLSVAPGDRVALFLGNSPDFLAAYLGTWLAGGVVVLVNTQYRQVELRHIFTDSGARVCVTDAALRTELERTRSELPALAHVIEAGQGFDSAAAVLSLPQEDRLPHGDDLAVIGYTSGTTGRSKGAMLQHRNLIANITNLREAWRWTADDHLLLTLPLFHAHGLMVGAHGTLTAGATMTLHRRFVADQVYDALCTEPLTMFFGVPTMYLRLIQEAQQTAERPRSLRLYVSGSAPLSPQTFAEWKAITGQMILERYGMTETIMNTTNPYDGERRPGTVGMPFPRQEARIVDVRTRRPLPDNETGEIEVRGPHVFAGYWERPDATAAAFDPDGWFATGDLGHRDADGYYTISGRAKELIISGGYNIYPREVEEVLEQCPGVAEVAVVGLPEAEFGEQVAAVVVRNDPALTRDALIDFCRDQLASYKKPRVVVFVESLPRNALGKVQKHLVREQIS
jgi:malonyl-CoA/methylmalonyl-CoA synthetase